MSLRTYVSHLLQFGDGTRDGYTALPTRIAFKDEWVGLSPFSPMVQEHKLKQIADGYVGTSEMRIGGLSSSAGRIEPLTSSAPLGVASRVIQEFMQVICAAPIVPGEYRPAFSHTDDYPKLKIDLQFDGSTLVLFSTSQGKRHVPWGVKAGITWVINSDAPSAALDILRPYLNPGAMDALKQKAGM